MSEPIRILHVFAALDSGGVSNFVMNLYRAVDIEKIQFDFAMTSGKKALYDNEVLSRGGRIFYFNTSKSVQENIHEILKENSFDVVHSHVFFYSGLVLFEAKRARVPIRIAHAHNAHTGESRSLFRLAYEQVMRALIRRYASLLLGCSEKACRYVFGENILSDVRVAVLPDGIDCDRFAFQSGVREQVRKAYGLDGKYVVGHVGHFNAAKNHEKILSVFSEICRRRADAALLLVGDGEMEGDIRKCVQLLGLNEKVVFAGAHRDVERFYQAMDVFLFPSRYEGFGMAMIEAQAGGLACLASDVVTQETQMSEAVQYLPLEENSSVWADVLLNLPSRSTNLALNKINVQKYDSVQVAKEYEKLVTITV